MIEVKLPAAATAHFAEQLVGSVGMPSSFASVRVPPQLIKRRIVFGITGHNSPNGAFRLTAIFKLAGAVALAYGTDIYWNANSGNPIVSRTLSNCSVRDPASSSSELLRGVCDVVNVNCDTIDLLVENFSTTPVTGTFIQVLRVTSGLPF